MSVYWWAARELAERYGTRELLERLGGAVAAGLEALRGDVERQVKRRLPAGARLAGPVRFQR